MAGVRCAAGRNQPRRGRQRADEDGRRDAPRAQVGDGLGARPLRETFARRCQDQRHVRERGRRQAERAVERELARRRARADRRRGRRGVISIAASSTTTASWYAAVPSARRKTKSSMPAASAVTTPWTSSSKSMRAPSPAKRMTGARPCARARARTSSGGSAAAGARISRTILVGVVRRLGGARDVRPRARAGKRTPGGEQPFDRCVVAGRALALPIRRERAAPIGPFVPVEAQPREVLEDARLGARRHARAIEILDAHDERAAAAARIQPGEQRRACVANVQAPGGAGRVTSARRHRAIST